MNPEQLQNEIWEYFVNRRKSIAALRNDMNRDLGNKQIGLINQARSLIKSIATISMAALAFVPSLLGRVYIPYLVAGVISQFLVVIMALSLLREDIDKDQAGLRDIKNKYNFAIKETLDTTDKYINLGPNGLDPKKVAEYNEELEKSEAGREIKKENEELSIMWSGKKKMELRYVGEFILFLFLEGSLFLFLSVTEYRFAWWILTILTISIYLLSLLPWADKVVGVFSRLNSFGIQLFSKRKD